MGTLKSGIYFLQGSEACAEAAIMVGCRFFAGYPITPATEIAEHMAKRLPQIGGIAIQMEDEIASIGAVIGASWAGAKGMTATSGPGFSLMQESIGYAFMTETPCVIVDVQRAGPSTGQATKCGQGDVMQSRWGTHGDYSAVVLSPNSVQEMFDLTVRAFNLAEKYRTPVVLLSDEVTAHMRERVVIPPIKKVEIINRKKPKRGDKAFFGLEEVPPMPSVGEGFNVAVTGSTHNEYGIRFTADPLVHRKLVERLNGKIQNHIGEIADVESYKIDDCQIGIVSYGCTSRAIYDVIEAAETKGVKVGYVRLKTLWPFPDEIIKKLAETANKIIVPEMNLRQIFYEVKRAAEGQAQVIPMNKIGGGELITPEELLDKILEEAKKGND
ncbi:MAG: 2-oxoacid:acceptor oxidoreductase subunit alpha [Candidatus Bathyarchaeota archaeon]|jgi:2-oxoglutarate ferredoxin oxidoreductase subunit alpha|nr:2-oxoacid:acceptor oxidoreductase subunit alpha [Candidatus Bathyarchaeota archaeon A05DMB-3]MDH7606267.1 2-oxoacid:acceptor oxidoreductase subunit alpha [Candidatus Bathyarchaeota archaeon]